MKKTIIFLMSLVLICLISVSSHAFIYGDYNKNGKIGLEDSIGILQVLSGVEDSAWVLYDDFNSDQINSELWVPWGDSATITQESGKIKFEHKAGFPNTSTILIFNNPARIKAVKAKIMVQSCTGDVRIRIVGKIGKNINDANFWRHIAIKNQDSNIRCFGYIDPEDKTTFDYYFKHPLEILNKEYNVEISFDKTSLWCEVENLGSATFTPEETVLSIAENEEFRGISTRSTNGDGPCTVLIDDVYVIYNQ